MNTKELPRNEIDEIISTLIRYKRLSIATTSILVAVATIYAFFIQKPIYQGTALIQIAKQNTFLLEDANALREKLIASYHIYTHPNQPLPHISNIKKPPYSTGFLELTAIGYTKDNIKTILSQSIDKIKKEHNSSIANYIKNQQSIIDKSKDNIDRLKDIISKREEDNRKRERLLDTLNDNQLALIAINSVTIIKNITEIIGVKDKLRGEENFLNSLNITLKPNRTFNTKLVDTIDIHPRAITPRKSIIIVVGFVSGILLSILLSFFLSFIAKEEN